MEIVQQRESNQAATPFSRDFIYKNQSFDIRTYFTVLIFIFIADEMLERKNARALLKTFHDRGKRDAGEGLSCLLDQFRSPDQGKSRKACFVIFMENDIVLTEKNDSR